MFEYTNHQLGQSSEEKNAAHWKQKAKEEGDKNVARGKELREKHGPIPSLSDVYAKSTKEAQEKHAQHLAEVAASPYALSKHVPLNQLPPNDILRRKAAWEHFNPGVPYPAELMSVQEKTQMENK